MGNKIFNKPIKWTFYHTVTYLTLIFTVLFVVKGIFFAEYPSEDYASAGAYFVCFMYSRVWLKYPLIYQKEKRFRNSVREFGFMWSVYFLQRIFFLIFSILLSVNIDVKRFAVSALANFILMILCVLYLRKGKR